MCWCVCTRYALMQQCWLEEAAERPSFSQIKTYLEEHLSVDPSDEKRDISEAAAYRPGSDTVEMRHLSPPARNDYLSLRQSIPVQSEYLSPSSPDL